MSEFCYSQLKVLVPFINSLVSVLILSKCFFDQMIEMIKQSAVHTSWKLKLWKIEQMDQVRFCSACFLGSKISQRFVEFSNSGSK